MPPKKLVVLVADPGYRQSSVYVPVNDQGYRIGERHHNAKFTDHEVSLAVKLVEEGMNIKTVAEKFEVSVETVKSWALGRRRGQSARGWRKVELVK